MTQLTVQQAFDLALRHHQAGRLADAEQIYRAILAQQPNHVGAMHYLGVLAHQAGQKDAAIDLIRRSIALNPREASAHSNLANALKDSGLPDEAIAACRESIVLDPNSPAAHSVLASSLAAKGQLEEAVSEFRKTIALRPNDAEAYSNLGITLEDLSRRDEAIAAYRKAISLKSDCAEAHANLGLALLSSGEFAQGWQEFEWRLRTPAMGLARQLTQPYWNGQNISDQTLLVYTEGGFGDAIQFVRLLSAVKGRAGNVILECQPELLRLFTGMPGVDRLIPRGEALPPFDCRIPLQSLPRILGIHLETIPADVPYLHAPQEAVEHWRQRIPNDRTRNIGLCWSGSQNELKRRSRELSLFSPLAQIPDARFFSLQKGPDGDQPPPPGLDLINFTRELNDFGDMAGLIENLDLVISVDTSMAHLAGALGKPVWVLIPHRPDFRWLLDRPDSPWYPTMKLFRQDSPHDWTGAIVRMFTALSDRTKIQT
jgi:Flp pilus assembly protein TadD